MIDSPAQNPHKEQLLSRQLLVFAMAVVSITFFLEAPSGSDLRLSPVLVYSANGFESLVALGQRYPLSHIALDELEMIPGIGPTKAIRILKEKKRLIDLNLEFEAVSGIGPKTASLLRRFIDLKEINSPVESSVESSLLPDHPFENPFKRDLP